MMIPCSDLGVLQQAGLPGTHLIPNAADRSKTRVSPRNSVHLSLPQAKLCTTFPPNTYDGWYARSSNIVARPRPVRARVVRFPWRGLRRAKGQTSLRSNPCALSLSPNHMGQHFTLVNLDKREYV
jgi:hypothetical protein